LLLQFFPEYVAVEVKGLVAPNEWTISDLYFFRGHFEYFLFVKVEERSGRARAATPEQLFSTFCSGRPISNNNVLGAIILSDLRAE
jgi:hypothetical protein